MNAEKALPFGPTVFGLGALFGTLLLAVVIGCPKSKDRDEKRGTVKDHISHLFFVQEELEAMKLLPGPDYRWSHFLEQPVSDCNFVGGNVWRAHGWVSKPKGRWLEDWTWEVYFSPGNAAPIYARAGKVEEGDREAAKRLADEFGVRNGKGQAHGK